MKPGIVIVTICVLVLTGVFASVVWAGSSTTTQIIHDAADGRVNGHYTAAQVRAALAAVNSNPAYSQYSDVAGVLQTYLTSLRTSGSGTGSGTTTGAGTTGTIRSAAAIPSAKLPAGELDYTGGQPLLAFAVGGALIIAGAALRRRWA
jgi:hypothetical protein